MTITVKPDPAHALGGYALATFKGASGAAGAAAGSKVTLRITRPEDGHFLGAGNWSSKPAELGPFEVKAEADGVSLQLGPEVVNLIEPFQRIRIEAPELGQSAELSWPESIRKAPGGSRGGAIHRRRGIGKPAPKPAETPPPEPPAEEAKERAPPKPTPEAEDLAAVDQGPRDDRAKDGKDEAKRSPLGLALVIVALVAALGVGAWYYLSESETTTVATPDPEPEPDTGSDSGSAETPSPEPAVGSLCNLDQVGGAEAARLVEMAEACGADQITLKEQIIDLAALKDYGPALLQQACWFDPACTDEPSPYESRNAASAARLYKKALDAGEEAARAPLEAVCALLKDSSDPVAALTAKNHCN